MVTFRKGGLAAIVVMAWGLFLTEAAQACGWYVNVPGYDKAWETYPEGDSSHVPPPAEDTQGGKYYWKFYRSKSNVSGNYTYTTVIYVLVPVSQNQGGVQQTNKTTATTGAVLLGDFAFGALVKPTPTAAPTLKENNQSPKKEGGPTSLHANGNPTLSYQAAASAPVAAPTWSISASSSLRYIHTDYLARKELDGSGASSNSFGGTIRAGTQWDKLSLDLLVPIDRVAYGGVYDHNDYTRLGFMLAPRYEVLSEGKYWLTMSIGFGASYFHTWFDSEDEMRIDPDDVEDVADLHKAASNFDNPDHIGVGPLLSLSKTIGKFTTSVGGVLYRSYNVDGDEELSEDEHIDISMFGVRFDYAITSRLGINAMLIYTHIHDLPGLYDQDMMNVGAGLTYTIKNRWTLDATFMRDFSNADENVEQYHVGLGWTF